VQAAVEADIAGRDQAHPGTTTEIGERIASAAAN
jgi:hypothetical protein